MGGRQRWAVADARLCKRKSSRRRAEAANASVADNWRQITGGDGGWARAGGGRAPLVSLPSRDETCSGPSSTEQGTGAASLSFILGEQQRAGAWRLMRARRCRGRGLNA